MLYRSALLFSLFLFGFCQVASAQEATFLFRNDLEFRDEENRPLRMPFAGGLNAPQYSTMDLNYDGIEDLVVFDRYADRLLTFIRSGNSYDYEPKYENRFPENLRHWMILRDMNCDGKKDIITSAGFGIDVYINRDAADGNYRWLYISDLKTETPNGNFVIPATSADLPAVADVDGDGDLDILVFDFTTSNQVNYNRNMSVETYGDCSELLFVRETRNWGNFRECGCGSISLEGEECSTNGRLEENEKLQHAGGKSIALYDADEDGDMDMLLGDESCEVFYFLENGGTAEEANITSFTTLFPGDVPARPGYLPTAFLEDVGGDSRKDLIVAAGLPPRTEVNADYQQGSWYYEATDEGFELKTRSFLQEDMVDLGAGASVAVYDVDADGDEDLLAATYGTASGSGYFSTLHLYENIAQPSGKPIYKLANADYLDFSSLRVRNLRIGIGEVNGDGLPDLLFMATEVNGFSSNLYYVLNTGPHFGFDIRFAKEIVAGATITSTFTMEDVDGDGLDDLLVGRQFGGVSYYHNNLGTFSKRADAFLGIDDDATHARPHLVAGDFTRDGRRDMIVSDFSGRLYLYPDYRNFPEGAEPSLVTYDKNQDFEPIRSDNSMWLAAVKGETGNKDDIIAATARGGLVYMMNRNMNGSFFPVREIPDLYLSAFPNPALNGNLKLVANKTCIIDIFDPAGREVYTDFRISEFQEKVISLEMLPKGMYIIRARTNEESYITRVLHSD